MDQYTIKVLCRKEWEAGVQHGIACEQQRIIKLLEEQINWLLDQKTFDRTAEAEVWIRAAKLVSKEKSK
jgi:hypothetical protein